MDIPEGFDDARPRRRKWPWISLGIVALLLGAVIGTWNVSLPYFAMSPGPVRDIGNLVTVGAPESFDPSGELFLVTILSQDVNPFELLVAYLDDTIDVIDRELVRPAGQTNAEYRTAVLDQMEESKRTAIAVALEHAGYDIELTGEGVLVSGLVEDAPAAGVLQVGDVIVEIDGERVEWAPDSIRLISDHEIGDTLSLRLTRDGKQLDVEVTLIEHVNDPSRPMVGFLASTYNEHLGDLPFPVFIDSENIGGPSAGLMYTLTIIEILGEEDLTRGRRIAGTGVIGSDGSIGAIGSIRQKVAAARAEGADILFVPEGNYERAMTIDPGDMVVVPVATIDDAIAYLLTDEAA